MDSGVLLSDGDGTVPLLSLGGLCRNQWHQHQHRLNPAGVSVVTREYRHEHDPNASLGLFQHLQNLRNFMR